MAAQSTCGNCSRSVKENWLACHYCNQPRWTRIRPYFIWGAIFVVFALWAVQSKTVFTFPNFGNLLTVLLPIAGVILGVIGLIMLMMALIASVRGLGVKREKTASYRPMTTQTANAGNAPKDISDIKMVIPLSGGVLAGMDETILRQIDDHIRYANNEKNWDPGSLIQGQENRAAIPYNTLSIIDHLLVDHTLTSETTLAHLIKLGNESLRERIIRVLGIMSTKEVLPILEKFASSDPFRKTYYSDSDGNMTYADNSDYEYPLRILANEEIRKIKTGL